MKVYQKLTVILLALSVFGCVNTKYKNRELTDGNEGTKKYFFAYGNYCGAGWPPPNSKKKQPLDDLDAMCFAHDSCYELTHSNSISCDDALHSMAVKYQYKFSSRGCKSLAGDVSAAFFAKNNGKGKSASEDASTAIVSTFVGVPLGVGFKAIDSVLAFGAKDAIEGRCNIEGINDPQKIIDKFETYFKKAIFNDNNEEINIQLNKVNSL
jgi:hypothetical protein